MVLQNHKSKCMWMTPFCKSDHKCYFSINDVVYVLYDCCSSIMRQLIILWMIVVLQHSTNAQFSECNGARCPDGM